MIRPRASAAVLVRAAQELAADAARLQARPHDEQRQAPDALAQQRQRAAREPVLVLGHPRPARIAAHEVAVADVAIAGPGSGSERPHRGGARDPSNVSMVSSSTASTSASVIGRITGMAPRLGRRMRSFSLDGHGWPTPCTGKGRALTVLLHGLLFNQRMHESLARALAARGHRVVTLDLLGHGDSDRPADKWRYSMPTFGPRSSRCSTTSASPRRSSWARRWARTWRSRPPRRRRSACAGW